MVRKRTNQNMNVSDNFLRCYECTCSVWD